MLSRFKLAFILDPPLRIRNKPFETLSTQRIVHTPRRPQQLTPRCPAYPLRPRAPFVIFAY